MNVEEVRNFALTLPDVEECLPFGPDNLVFKVKNKIFLLMSLDDLPLSFNVKCDPEDALLYREKYSSVLPGYHMNKKHWNTVIADGTLPDDFLKKMIEDSYVLVSKNKSFQKQFF